MMLGNMGSLRVEPQITNLSSVPEPAILVICGIGLMILFIRRNLIEKN